MARIVASITTLSRRSCWVASALGAGRACILVSACSDKICFWRLVFRAHVYLWLRDDNSSAGELPPSLVAGVEAVPAWHHAKPWMGGAVSSSAGTFSHLACIWGLSLAISALSHTLLVLKSKWRVLEREVFDVVAQL